MINEFKYFDDEIRRIEQIPNKKEFIREFRIWRNKALKYIEDHYEEMIEERVYHNIQFIMVSEFVNSLEKDIRDKTKNYIDVPNFGTKSFPAMIIHMMHMSGINRIMLKLSTNHLNEVSKTSLRIIKMFN